MNVLSLFDGMSCGQIALERAGINVSKYYAAELDKNYFDGVSENQIRKMIGNMDRRCDSAYF